jgi:hypothetical protein
MANYMKKSEYMQRNFPGAYIAKHEKRRFRKNIKAILVYDSFGFIDESGKATISPFEEKFIYMPITETLINDKWIEV